MAEDPKEKLFDAPPAQGDDANHASIVALFAGKYTVLERLSWNGLALVYRVRVTWPDDGLEERAPGGERAVALLPIDCESKPELLRPFEGQAARLVAFEHPHAVSTLASGALHGVPYLVLPHTPGTTVAEELAVLGAMPAARALSIADAVLEALGAAHARGLRHWDLTPSNVLLTTSAAGEESAQLIAMGLAPMVRAMTDTDMTGPTGKGSGPSAARYLAPELQRGSTGTTDGRADLYSVGGLLIAMITGHRPSKTREELKAPAIGVVKGLAAVLERALAEEPSTRFATAEEFREALATTGRGRVSVRPAPVASAAPADDEEGPTTMMAVPTAPQQPAAVTAETEPNADAQPKADAPPKARRELEPTMQTLPLAKTDSGAPAPKASRGPAVALGLAAMLVVCGGVAYWAGTRPPTGSEAETPAEAAAAAAAVAAATAAPTPTVVVDAPAPTPTVVDAPAPTPTVVDAPAPTPTVVDAPAPTPTVVDAPAPAPAPSGAGPLDGELPEPLSGLLPRIANGDRLTPMELGPLYVYAGSRGGDVRGHLLLARAFKNLRWTQDVVARYEVALRVDAETSKRDPRILSDLLEIVARDVEREPAATRIVTASWGTAALPAIDALLASTTRRDMVSRLRHLRDGMSPP